MQNKNKLIVRKFDAYTEKNPLPEEVTAFIDLLFNHIGLKTEAEEKYIKEIDELNEKYIKLGKESILRCDQYTESLQKTGESVIGFFEPLLVRIKADREFLEEKYSAAKEKSSRGGKAGQKYKLHQAEIKLALDKHLDATNENPFTLNDAAAQIAYAIEKKTGIHQEPSENQIGVWKKRYKATNRQSIYG